MESRAHQHLKKMQEIQKMVINFVDDEKEIVNDPLNFDYFEGLKDEEKKYRLKEILSLIVQISNEHLHKTNFYQKIDSILKKFSNDIKQNYSNDEIMKLFGENKRLQLFLLKEKIIDLDKSTINYFLSNKGVYYFLPELDSFYGRAAGEEEDIGNKYKDFEENRLKGENEKAICEIIRKDSVEEFTSYIKENNIDVNDNIISSIFETNNYLMNNNPCFINYAAFYGSNKIFQYLISEKAKITKKTWYYAIHGNNQEIMQYLNDKINKATKLEIDYYNYAILCYQNKTARLIDNNRNFNAKSNSIKINISIYNYELIEDNHFMKYLEFFVKYDYPALFYCIFSSHKIDANKIIFQPNGENTLLSIASANNCIEIAELLLKQPETDPNIKLLQLNKSMYEYYDIDLKYQTNDFTGTVFLLLLAILAPFLFYYIFQKYSKLRFCVCSLAIAYIIYLFYVIKNISFTKLLKYLKLTLIGKISYDVMFSLLSFTELNSSTLFLAIINQHEDMVKLLSANPKIDINQKTPVSDNCEQFPETYLTTATFVGNTKIVQILISNPNLTKDDIHKYDPNLTGNLDGHCDPCQTIEYIVGYDPIVGLFQTALQNRNKEIVQFFLENLEINQFE
ncbi:hypothetical protein M9Y10_018824 [Tritrichomonas musculus]|uniref:DUF3447 domain-containing protein n=1 Tax=Tritrichomonas musculus TaxID=1915356 RepID=A0ABR2HHV6_9EUKA